MSFSWKHYTLKIMTILKTFQREPRRRFLKKMMGLGKKRGLGKRWILKKKIGPKRSCVFKDGQCPRRWS